MEHFVAFPNTVTCEQETNMGGREYDDLLDMTSHENSQLRYTRKTYQVEMSPEWMRLLYFFHFQVFD